MTDRSAAAAVRGTGPAARRDAAGVPGCARRTPDRNDGVCRVPVLAQLLAALIALGGAAFWPGAAPRAGQALPWLGPAESGPGRRSRP